MKDLHFIPALTAQAAAFAEHLADMVDQLPRGGESLPSRQAYFSGQALAEQLERAGAASTSDRRQSAIENAVAEARSAGYWLDALLLDMPEAARLCAPLHEEADHLADALVEAAY